MVWATQATVRWARRWATRGPMRLEGRTHTGVRATGTAIGALFLNLFGLAAGLFVAGVLSDVWGLTLALTVMPAFGVLAVLAFLRAGRSYEADMARANEAPSQPLAGLPAPA